MRPRHHSLEGRNAKPTMPGKSPGIGKRKRHTSGTTPREDPSEDTESCSKTIHEIEDSADEDVRLINPWCARPSLVTLSIIRKTSKYPSMSQ